MINYPAYDKQSMYQDDFDSDMMFCVMKQKGKPYDYDPCEPNMGSIYDYMQKPASLYPNPHEKMYQPAMPIKSLINQVKECAMTCHEMINHLIDKDCNARRTQIKLLHDCSRVCDEQTIYLVTRSVFSKQHASICGLICETCGNECAKHPDAASQHCARICLECAKACYEYARM